ncbi:YbbN family protein [Actinotignum timonense]|uniref:hypothetical protein n=1 Tax=Actinotignum timonense TaxID=1870995 RepID=UPI003897D193|nr:hypothetical protein [Gleimia europaea]
MPGYRPEVPTLLLYTASWVPYDRPMRVIFEESVVDLHRFIPDVSFDAWCVNLDILTQPPVGPRRRYETTAAAGADAETQHILPDGAPEHQIDFSELSAEVTRAIQRALGYGGIDPVEGGLVDSDPANAGSADTRASNPWDDVAAFIPRLEWLPTLLLVHQGKEYARFAGLVPKLEIRAELLAQLPSLGDS